MFLPASLTSIAFVNVNASPSRQVLIQLGRDFAGQWVYYHFQGNLEIFQQTMDFAIIFWWETHGFFSNF